MRVVLFSEYLTAVTCQAAISGYVQSPRVQGGDVTRATLQRCCQDMTCALRTSDQVKEQGKYMFIVSSEGEINIAVMCLGDVPSHKRLSGQCRRRQVGEGQ